MIDSIRTRLLLPLLLMLSLAGHAATYEQVIELRPGWNAIHVEVDPEVSAIEQVFAGIPVASVWRWLPDDRPLAFIRNPDEDLLTIDGWYGYFPPERPESILTNLFTVSANQSYLVRLTGSQPVTLRINGRPSLRNQRWRSNDFQFTGFPVDPGNEPTFGSWFSGSDAHEGQSIFELSAQGEWEEVTHPHTRRIRSGRAYWVFTRGRSTWQGPMAVELEFGDRFDFGSGLARDRMTVRNRSGLGNQLRIRSLVSDQPVPLSIQQIDPDTGDTFWPRLPTEATIALPVDEAVIVRLGVRRADLFSSSASHILELTNGFGARQLIEVSAQASQPSIAFQETVPRRDSGGQLLSADPRYAGLWLGVVSIDAVSMAQQGGVIPKPTGQAFPMRILLHVDAGGTTRMLKEVIQMWEEGTEVPDPENPEFFITETPGRFVLLTDDTLIPNYSGAVLRGGQPVGIRMSTASYDFPGQSLELTGAFGSNGLLNGSIVLEPDFPTNPYLHRYHPDHDNLDAQFTNFQQEAYEVTREMEMFFAAEDPEDFDRPEWGDGELAGSYTEAISGVHRSTIFVSGTFRLRRVSSVPLLNQ